MEQFMVTVCIEGRIKAYCFKYADNAKEFNKTMNRTYFSKLYVYIPETDSWESAADQF